MTTIFNRNKVNKIIDLKSCTVKSPNRVLIPKSRSIKLFKIKKLISNIRKEHSGKIRKKKISLIKNGSYMLDEKDIKNNIFINYTNNNNGSKSNRSKKLSLSLNKHF